VQREPAALIDVLRAAQSEVEHYTRVEFGMIDRDIEVAAHAVNDLVHLVAELFDNATAFSPPDSHVMVEARRVGEFATLYVEDRGIGIMPDQLHELNEKLAMPPQVDVAVSRMMGLVVVARLGTRHGVKVELRSGGDRGTVAEVTLPVSVLVPRALSGRLTGPGSLPFQTTNPAEPPPQQPRPTFGAPLALESGNGDRDGDRRHEESRRSAPAGPPAASRPFEPTPAASNPIPTSSPRAMPAWSDLTGAQPAVNGGGFSNGSDIPSGILPRSSGDVWSPRIPTEAEQIDPLPQRRRDEPAVEGEVTPNGSTPHIPRQIPNSPEGLPRSGGPPPVSALPARPASGPLTPPVVSAPPSTTSPSAAAPPAWPPVVVPDREAATPPVPERLAAALDMTAELPRVSRPEEKASTPAKTTPAIPFADATMELPIFRELESAWFRTRRDEPRGATPTKTPAADKRSETPPTSVGSPTEKFVTIDAGRPNSPASQQSGTESPTITPPVVSTPKPTPTPTRAPSAVPAAASGLTNGSNGAGQRIVDAPNGGWRTAADDGWRAATAAAAEKPVAETTQAGLPKRVPMAQLVPGGVDKGAASVQRRTPEAVRGLLSAYHRGVQRGRTQPKDDSPENSGMTSNGQQSSQAGKEHEG
jgi:hypothetical protein